MTSRVKRGLLAIGLSAGLLFLPFAMMAWVITLGGADPLLGMMAAFAAGTMIAFVGLIASAFAWRGGRWRGLVVFFVVVVAVDLAWLPVGWAWDLKSRPYERADVAFAQLEEPAVDLSGTWEGKWVDPRRSYSEGIVLKLNQADGRVSGSITTGWSPAAMTLPAVSRASLLKRANQIPSPPTSVSHSSLPLAS